VVVVIRSAVAVLGFTFEVVHDIDQLFVDHPTKFAVDRGETEALPIANGLGVQLLGANKTRHRGEGRQHGRPRLTRHAP
jgi:hypothetical protein